MENVYEKQGEVSEYLMKRVLIEALNKGVIAELVVEKFKIELNTDNMKVDAVSLELFSACGYSLKLSSSGKITQSGPWIKGDSPVDIYSPPNKRY